MLVFGGAGGRNNEARIQVDGLNTGAAFNGAGVSSYMVDISNAQEIATTTSGGLGEAEVGGPSFSIVPKTGGNPIRGSFYQSNVTKGMVGDNYSAELQAAGLTTPGKLFKLWDSNLGVGGPIAKDQRVVLLPVPRSGQPPDRSWHVRQREHGRPHEVELRSRSQPPGGGGGKLAQRVDPSDRAADREAQDQRVLGSAAAVSGRRLPRVRRRMPSVRRERDHLRCGGRVESALQRH